MSKAPAFQFYANDFATGCALMTPAEVGCYILMLCHQWDHGFLPTDAIALQMLCRSTVPVSEKVLAKFSKGPDGMLRNARLEKSRADQITYRERISKVRSAASRKRWDDPNAKQEHSNRNAFKKRKTEVEVEDGSEVKKEPARESRKQPDARIDECIAHFTERVKAPPEDASKWVRIHVSNLLKYVAERYPTHDPVVSVKTLIDAALALSFHREHTTTFQYLWKYRGTIIKTYEASKNDPKTQSDHDRKQQLADAATRHFGKAS